MDLYRITIETTSEAVEAVCVVTDLPEIIGQDIEDSADLEARSAQARASEWIDEAFLNRTGAKVNLYVDQARFSDEEVKRLVRFIEQKLDGIRAIGLDVGSLLVSVEAIPEAAYLLAYKEHFHTLRVSPRVIIAPSWEMDRLSQVGTIGANDVVLEIDPGMAFGTGTHETTQLMLTVMEGHAVCDARVLDLGTGTGVLALAAAKFGAHSVTAVDVDGNALAVARDNAVKNGVADRIQMVVSDLARDLPSGQTYDFVYANLLLDLLLRLLPDIKRVLSPNGTLSVSGIVHHQVEAVAQAAREQHLEIIEIHENADWRALVFTFTEESGG